MNKDALSEAHFFIGIALQYLERKDEALVHFKASHELIEEIIKSKKREDNPKEYDNLVELSKDIAVKLEDCSPNQPQVSVKEEMAEFGNGFTKPLPSNSPIKDLGVFGKGTKGTPRLATNASSPAKRKIETESNKKEEEEGSKKIKS